jgi:phenylpropionate dioxygenase-like ring-hydroxylating dioxygenase large terminal subunit
LDAALIARLEQDMEREARREAPPEDFPALPPIPTARYTDPAFLELEREHLWGRCWLLAAHKDEFQRPGCFRLWDRSDEPIVIVRGRDDVYRAFYNACQHRGAPLVREPAGRTRRFVCKYHAWTYELDGELVGVPDEEDFVGLDKSCLGLQTLRCETWGGWIFVNRDPEAVPLMEYLGPIPEGMAQYGPDTLRFIDRHSVTLECNWKAAVEAFLEVYHLKFIHPTTVSSLLDHRRTTISLFADGHSRMVSAKRPESVDSGFGVGVVPMIPTVSELPKRSSLSFFMFPNLVTPTDTTGFPFLQFWPKGTGVTEMEISWYVADWGEGALPEFWKAFMGVFDLVLDEDTQNLAWIQRSMESPGFHGSRLNYQERRLYYLNEEIDRVIGVDHIPPEWRVKRVLDGWVEEPEGRRAGP